MALAVDERLLGVEVSKISMSHFETVTSVVLTAAGEAIHGSANAIIPTEINDQRSAFIRGLTFEIGKPVPDHISCKASASYPLNVLGISH